MAGWDNWQKVTVSKASAGTGKAEGSELCVGKIQENLAVFCLAVRTLTFWFPTFYIKEAKSLTFREGPKDS